MVLSSWLTCQPPHLAIEVVEVISVFPRTQSFRSWTYLCKCQYVKEFLGRFPRLVAGEHNPSEKQHVILAFEAFTMYELERMTGQFAKDEPGEGSDADIHGGVIAWDLMSQRNRDELLYV